MKTANDGLHDKFEVRRKDGSSLPGRKHANCRYFVLDLDHDRHAFDAIEAYAASCCQSLPALALDLLLAAEAMPSGSLADPSRRLSLEGRRARRMATAALEAINEANKELGLATPEGGRS